MTALNETPRSGRHIDADALAGQLAAAGVGPLFGTPCGVLAPLYAALSRRGSLQTISREDVALGLAVGAALASRPAGVVMQNSGLGQCVNALASLVAPYRVPILLIVSLRGTGQDHTEENVGMGGLTADILTSLRIPWTSLDVDSDWTFATSETINLVTSGRSPAALLFPPEAFGWKP